MALLHLLLENLGLFVNKCETKVPPLHQRSRIVSLDRRVSHSKRFSLPGDFKARLVFSDTNALSNQQMEKNLPDKILM